ncbi:MAG TPA: M23 family metallopeptidase [Frankiaceae bacterium]|nr:M23 family metallopeptidase [Frankiaceae bacterium]
MSVGVVLRCRALAAATVAAIAVPVVIAGPAIAATPEQITILSPVSGRVTSHPSDHHFGDSGHWSEDIAASDDAPVYARFARATGSVRISVEAVAAACRTGTGGQAIRLGVTVDGVRLGTVSYLHLAGLRKRAGDAVAPGEQLGVQATGLPTKGNESCWTGPHVHLEARNASSYSCYAPVSLGQSLNSGSAVGVLGGAYANGVRSVCPAGATNGLVEGLFIRNAANGRVYRIAGGAPIYVSTWDAFGGPKPTYDVDDAYLRALRPWPRDMFLRGSRSGRVFRVVSGHRYHIDSWTPYGGVQPHVNVDDWSLDHCDHLRCTPFGRLDEARGVPGGAYVRGWAMDPDTTDPVTVHVWASGQNRRSFVANVSRPDVDNAYHRGSRFGFAHTVPLPPGEHVVCPHPINVGQGSTNPSVGCATVTALPKVSTSLSSGLSISTVTYGAGAKFVGTLRRRDNGAVLTGAPVAVQSRPLGGSTWTTAKTVLTSSTGRIETTVTPKANTEYRLHYAGSFSLASSASTIRPLRVRTRVSLTSSATSVRVGGAVTFAGTVAPGHAGQGVNLQRYADGVWRTVRTVTLSSTSTYRTTLTMNSRTDFTWRVYKPGDADHVAGSSRSVRIAVA